MRYAPRHILGANETRSVRRLPRNTPQASQAMPTSTCIYAARQAGEDLTAVAYGPYRVMEVVTLFSVSTVSWPIQVIFASSIDEDRWVVWLRVLLYSNSSSTSAMI